MYSYMYRTYSLHMSYLVPRRHGLNCGPVSTYNTAQTLYECRKCSYTLAPNSLAMCIGTVGSVPTIWPKLTLESVPTLAPWLWLYGKWSYALLCFPLRTCGRLKNLHSQTRNAHTHIVKSFSLTLFYKHKIVYPRSNQAHIVSWNMLVTTSPSDWPKWLKLLDQLEN